MERYKAEVLDVEGAPECIQISGLMHGITHPELIKCLYKKIPRSMEEIYRVTTSFLKGEVAAFSHSQKKAPAPLRQLEEGNKLNFKKEKGKFKAPPPMVTPVEKRDPNKYYEFHTDKGHSTDECMQLRKHIDEMIKSGEEDGTKGPMIIKAEIGGHFVHRIYVDGGASSEVLYEHCFPIGQISLLVKIDDEENSTSASMNFMVIRQKKRGQAPERNKAIQEEVEKLVDAGITKEVHYHSWLSNPVMVRKHDGSWRMCVNFKDLNKACPQDGYPLPEIDWKVESLSRYPLKCFLDAYKGYHQIKMAEEDEEKTAFITSQGIFCYTKMSFSLKNAGATYQRLVNRAFQKQIGRNLEVYVDDLVIKSHMEKEIILDIADTFKTLRFLSKSAEKSLSFFKTLKKCTKKSDFQWTQEAEIAFRQMKKLIADLLMLTALKEKEELIIYLAAAKEAISAVLMTEREGKQMPVYFVSRALQGPEINYTPMEKLVLALLSASRRLKRYIQAHTIVVITDQPIKQLLSNSEITRRMLKWKFKLEGYDIQYKPRISIKGQILADYIVERPEEESSDELMIEPEELPEPWTLFTDGSSCIDGSGAGLIITNSERVEFTYAMRFKFEATNNEAEYEALIASLRIAE
ncbi:reverse transcriptase domain-containing protein [Tanacetum coccineum]